MGYFKREEKLPEIKLPSLPSLPEKPKKLSPEEKREEAKANAFFN